MEQSKIDAAAAPAAVVDRAALTAAMTKVKLVTESRSTIPILSNVRITSEAGELLLIATDMDMEMRIRLAGEVDGRFDTTINTDMLLSMCRKAPKAEKVSIELDATETPDEGNQPSYDISSLVFGKALYRLNTIGAADYPPLKDFQGATHKFEVPGSAFWNAFDAVREAISTEETRYYLNGVYLHRNDTALRATATDGHRLYCQDMLPPDGSKDMPGVIIPRKMVEILHKLMKGKDAPAKARVRLDEELISVAWGNITIRSKLVDGSFPDYGRVLPSGNDKVATVDARALTEHVEAVTVISSERGRAVKATFGNGFCAVSVNNPDTGIASSAFECDYEGDTVEIGFNAQYLLSVIKTACPTGGDLVLKMGDTGSPVLITGDEYGWTGCLMPMRV